MLGATRIEVVHVLVLVVVRVQVGQVMETEMHQIQMMHPKDDEQNNWEALETCFMFHGSTVLLQISKLIGRNNKGTSRLFIRSKYEKSDVRQLRDFLCVSLEWMNQSSYLVHLLSFRIRLNLHPTHTILITLQITKWNWDEIFWAGRNDLHRHSIKS